MVLCYFGGIIYSIPPLICTQSKALPAASVHVHEHDPDTTALQLKTVCGFFTCALLL